MNRFLIDTDIFVDFLRDYHKSKELFNRIIKQEIAVFSSVLTLAELLSGEECKEPEKRKASEEIILLTTTIDADSFIARKAGEIRREYKIPLADCIIAATAIKLNIPILTRNTRHFSKIKG